MSEISNVKIMLGLSPVLILVGVGLISSGLLLGRKFQLIIGPGAAIAGGGVVWFAGGVSQIFFEKRNKNTVWIEPGGPTYIPIPKSWRDRVMVHVSILKGHAQHLFSWEWGVKKSNSASMVSQHAHDL